MSLELAFARKRKLSFVTGLVTRDPQDKRKQELWDTCNNVVIGWLDATMNEPIKKSVLYYTSARSMWLQLEKRYSVTNGATKYRLNKILYDTKQNEMPINEYYIKLCSIWEELENLNRLPVITQINPEINALIQALEQQKEEQHLFQFLNGLDEDYAKERSQLLMQTTLPSVERACASLQ
ncbi:V-type proton ATPase subunit a [Bienertia sinuspersici]